VPVVGFVCFLILNGRGTGPLTGEEKLFTKVLGLLSFWLLSLLELSLAGYGF
jgi:hypothetical protein